MKIETIYIEGLKKEFIFYIGKNQKENDEVINKSSISDVWFHANKISSCHVVCKLPEKLIKKEMSYIIKAGALLCKKNTKKLKSMKDVEIIYTYIKNIEKTDVSGCVVTKNTKIITC